MLLQLTDTSDLPKRTAVWNVRAYPSRKGRFLLVWVGYQILVWRRPIYLCALRRPLSTSRSSFGPVGFSELLVNPTPPFPLAPKFDSYRDPKPSEVAQQTKQTLFYQIFGNRNRFKRFGTHPSKRVGAIPLSKNLAPLGYRYSPNQFKNSGCCELETGAAFLSYSIRVKILAQLNLP